MNQEWQLFGETHQRRYIQSCSFCDGLSPSCKLSASGYLVCLGQSWAPRCIHSVIKWLGTVHNGVTSPLRGSRCKQGPTHTSLEANPFIVWSLPHEHTSPMTPPCITPDGLLGITTCTFTSNGLRLLYFDPGRRSLSICWARTWPLVIKLYNFFISTVTNILYKESILFGFSTNLVNVVLANPVREVTLDTKTSASTVIR